MSRLDQANIFDAGKHKPQSRWRRVETGGKVVIEKLPYARHVKYVKSTGNVCFIRIVTSPAIKKDATYEDRMEDEMRKGGAIPYAGCPLRSDKTSFVEGDFPKGPLRTACKRGEDGSYKKCCPHVAWVIEDWKAAHKKSREQKVKRRNRVALMEKAKLDAQLDANATAVKTQETMLEMMKQMREEQKKQSGK